MTWTDNMTWTEIMEDAFNAELDLLYIEELKIKLSRIESAMARNKENFENEYKLLYEQWAKTYNEIYKIDKEQGFWLKGII